MDNFNIRKFLTEHRITAASQQSLLNEGIGVYLFTFPNEKKSQFVTSFSDAHVRNDQAALGRIRILDPNRNQGTGGILVKRAAAQARENYPERPNYGIEVKKIAQVETEEEATEVKTKLVDRIPSNQKLNRRAFPQKIESQINDFEYNIGADLDDQDMIMIADFKGTLPTGGAMLNLAIRQSSDLKRFYKEMVDLMGAVDTDSEDGEPTLSDFWNFLRIREEVFSDNPIVHVEDNDKLVVNGKVLQVSDSIRKVLQQHKTPKNTPIAPNVLERLVQLYSPVERMGDPFHFKGKLARNRINQKPRE